MELKPGGHVGSCGKVTTVSLAHRLNLDTLGMLKRNDVDQQHRLVPIPSFTLPALLYLSGKRFEEPRSSWTVDIGITKEERWVYDTHSSDSTAVLGPTVGG